MIHTTEPTLALDSSPRLKGRPNGKLIAGIFGFWLILGLLYLLSLVLNAYQFDTGFRATGKTISGILAIYSTWALASIVIIELMRRKAQRSSARRYLVLLLLGAVFWLPFSLWVDASISDWMFDKPIRNAITILKQPNYFSVFFIAVLYFMVFFAGLGWIYLERWQQIKEAALVLEKQNVQSQLDLADMRMQVLKSQLSPHFLFNALGSISGLARRAPREQITKSLQTLGDMLRFALSTSEKRLTSIDSELKFTNSYVALQRLRFADRFSYSVDSDAPQQTACPPFVLQTLVENAFIHGVEKRAEPTRISATVRCTQDSLQIDVSNQIPREPDGLNGLGLALNNLSKRLDMIFESKAIVRDQTNDDTYVATVILPRTVRNT